MTDKKLSDVEIDGYLSRMRSLATMMLRTTKQTDKGMPGCRYGGQPTLPEHIEWPVYKCPFPEVDVPLHFIFQIDLRFVPRAMEYPDFPERGTLFVFVEPVLAYYDDTSPIPPVLTGEGAKVIYVAEDVSQCPPRKAPPLPDPDREFPVFGTLTDAREKMEAGGCGWYSAEERKMLYTGADGLRRWPMEFVVADEYGQFRPSDYPQWVDGLKDELKFWRQIEKVSKPRREAIEEYCMSYRDPDHSSRLNTSDSKRKHHMFGQAITPDDMRRSFEVTDQWPKLSENHVPLFTLWGGDDALGYSYPGDYGLVFWIDKDDLAAGNFENIQAWEY